MIVQKFSKIVTMISHVHLLAQNTYENVPYIMYSHVHQLNLH